MKIVILLLSAVLLLAGCGKSDERNHPLFQKAERAQSAGNGTEAAELFNELLNRRPRSVYTHLRLAAVYDELLNEPLAATFHYRKYLELMPDAPDADDVRAWLKACEKRFYESMKAKLEPPEPIPPVPESENSASEKTAPQSGQTADNVPKSAAADSEPTPQAAPSAAEAEAAAKEIAELKKLLSQHQVRYKLLQQELEKLRKNPPPAAAAEKSAPAEPEHNSAVRTYRVQPGDTPGKIARKVYGKSSLYTIILRANPKLDERKLRPGMIINLPPRP